MRHIPTVTTSTSSTSSASSLLIHKMSTTKEEKSTSSSSSPTVIPNDQAYEKLTMDEITSLCKRRGFIFPSSEIYNGMAGFYDYGPLGSELKKCQGCLVEEFCYHERRCCW